MSISYESDVLLHILIRVRVGGMPQRVLRRFRRIPSPEGTRNLKISAYYKKKYSVTVTCYMPAGASIFL